jgi:hypothetical protein
LFVMVLIDQNRIFASQLRSQSGGDSALTARDLPAAAGASLATSPGRPIARAAAHLWFFDTERLRAASATHAWLACLEEHERARFAAGGPG